MKQFNFDNAWTRLQKIRKSYSESRILEAAAAIMDMRAAELSTRIPLTSPGETRQYIQKALTYRVAELTHEVFGAIWLTNQHHIIENEILFNGTIDGAAVYPREVVKKALNKGAAAVVFYHNHPSGISEPSSADRNITERLVNALSSVDVRTLDHMVVGSTGNITSFSERGLI